MTKLGRNEPCTCNSGKKYKHCCKDKPFQGPIQQRPRSTRRGGHALAAIFGLVAAVNTENTPRPNKAEEDYDSFLKRVEEESNDK